MPQSKLSRSPFAEGICRDRGSQLGMSRSCWLLPRARVLSEVLKQQMGLLQRVRLFENARLLLQVWRMAPLCRILQMFFDVP